MKITTAVLTLLALAATQVNAAGAVIDTTLSGLPLTVAKRLDRAAAGAPATLGDRTTGVPMREAKMQRAPSSTAGKSGGSTAIEPSGVPPRRPSAADRRPAAAPVSPSIGQIT